MKVLKAYGYFWQNYRRRMIAVVILLILAGMIEAIGVAAFLPFLQIVLEPESELPDFAKSIVDVSGVPLNIMTVGGFIATAISCKALILWIAMSNVSRTVARISADMRLRLMRALLKANWGFFIRNTMGVTLNAIITEPGRSSTAFISAARLVASLIQVIIYAVGALIVSWKMFAGGLLIGLILAAALWNLVMTARRAGGRQTELAKALMHQITDMLQGIKPLRAMALEGKFLNLLTQQSKGLETAQADQLISGQAMRIFHEPLMVIAVVAGLVTVMSFATVPLSELALMGVLFMRLLTGMNQLQAEYQRLAIQESALWSLLSSIEKAESEADNWPGHGPVPVPIETLQFKDVSFSHDARPLLQNVNLNFRTRSLTALVGASGSGKTTLLDLLTGFHKPSEGVITANGVSISEMSLNTWRGVLGFVPQEVFLFNDTIYENIAMGRADIDEAQVWVALDAAGAREFVESRPGKLYGSVGENGRMLSGGQRQRIAIARAIVHRPQILVLDEATSAVDQETEKVLLRTLRELTKDMTVIFVSHNKGVVAVADYVYEVRDGYVSAAVAAA